MVKNGFLLIVLICQLGFSQTPLPIVPKPITFTSGKGSFILSNKTIIQSKVSTFEVAYLQEEIKQKTGEILLNLS